MPVQFTLQPHFRRAVHVSFDADLNTSDGGGILLKQVDQRFGIIDHIARCFRDRRDPRAIHYSVRDLLAQRILGLALGYEDLNDHERLRHDPLLAYLVDRNPDASPALAGKSTLNRLELPVEKPNDARYKKIEADPDALQRCFVDLFIQTRRDVPRELIIDLDATDVPLHGNQEGRKFHGYYDCYCYLPLYAFCDGFPLLALLQTADRDAAAGALDAVQMLTAALRAAWPDVRLIVRGDSGFCRDALMTWCEAHDVHYILGLARNSRLEAELQPAMAEAQAEAERTRAPARRFVDFTYETRDSWSRPRRTVGKAEYIGKPNPRFVVTNLAAAAHPAQALYETLYCARGEMENRIKEQQLDLFGDRTSSYSFGANQLRLFFSTVAYLLLHLLRDYGLAGTELARATCGSIRLKLLKIGGTISQSCRRIAIRLASGCPYSELIAAVQQRLSTT